MSDLTKEQIEKMREANREIRASYVSENDERNYGRMIAICDKQIALCDLALIGLAVVDGTKKVKIEGPAVDALEARRENG